MGCLRRGALGARMKHGLKADAITTDAARILRIPGTFNHKQTPPKPVRLQHLPADDLRLSKDLRSSRRSRRLPRR